MARKKISKKDLQRGVTRLGRKIKTLVARLERHESDLSSLQEGFGTVAPHEGASAELPALKTRLGELSGAAEALDERLRLVEQAYAPQQQITEELGARAQRLENRVAEAIGHGEELGQRTTELESLAAVLPQLREQLTAFQAVLEGLRDGVGRDYASIETAVEGLRVRTGQVERRLEELSEAQEGLDLRTALLSREAEAASTGPDAEARLSEDHGSSVQEAVDGLAGQMHGLAESFSLQTAASADLADRLERLEAAATELRASQHGLEEQSGRLKEELRQGALPGDSLRLLQEVPKLHGQASRAEDAAARVERRVAVLETANKSLSDQAETIVARLQALHAEGRLGDLEQSLQQERERIDEIQRARQTLDRQLGTALANTEALGEGIDSLKGDGARLNEALARLAEESRTTAQRLQQQAKHLQAHDDRLAQQHQRLEAAFADHRQAITGLKKGQAALDGSRQKLQEAVDGLGVQQVRQSHEAQELGQRLRKRSWLGFLLLLLVSSALGAWFYSSLSGLERSQVAIQEEAAAGKSALAATAGLENDVAELRAALSDRDDEVARLARSLEGSRGSPVQETSESLAALQERVDALGREGKDRQREVTELRVAQEQVRTELAAQATRLEVLTEPPPNQMVVAPDPRTSESLAALQESVEALGREGEDWQREVSELRAAQEQMRAQLEAQAVELKALAERPAVQTVAPAPASDKPGSRWSEARRSGLYTLQLGGFQRQESLDWFLRHHKIEGEAAVHKTERRGRPWWAVLHGIYGSFGEAAAAIGELPADLLALGPWVRKIPDRGDLSPLAR